jgi:6-pyruvoyltetrahydropterin/6-carboxytetrahydropterin synthase
MIYSVSKKMEVAGCHQLSLDYESKCTRLHGHNWNITVYLASTQLDRNGMVCDFTHIKHRIHDYLDHGNFNELLDFNPTAEHLAEWCVHQFPECYKAVVEESNANLAQAVDEHFPIDLKFLL